MPVWQVVQLKPPWEVFAKCCVYVGLKWQEVQSAGDGGDNGAASFALTIFWGEASVGCMLPWHWEQENFFTVACRPRLAVFLWQVRQEAV